MLTVRDRPLLVVPSMRWPAMTAAEPVMLTSP